MSYAVSLPVPALQRAQSPARLPSSVETQHLGILLQQVKNTQPVESKKSMVSRKDYPSIVKLKLAGNTDKSIAKKLGVQIEQLKPHVSRALSDYRKGKLTIDAGETVKEARKKGAEKSRRTISGLTPSPSPSPSASVATPATGLQNTGVTTIA